MDPNSSLNIICDYAGRCLNADESDSVSDQWQHHARTALEEFAALDEWLRVGGFAPQAWNH